MLERIGDRIDHFPVGEHAQLDRADAKIIEAGIDLRAQEFQRRHVYRGHAAGVLRGQRGDRGQPVHAVRGKGLEVGLNAGAAAGIGAGDGQRGKVAAVVHGAIVRYECASTIDSASFNALG